MNMPSIVVSFVLMFLFSGHNSQDYPSDLIPGSIPPTSSEQTSENDSNAHNWSPTVPTDPTVDLEPTTPNTSIDIIPAITRPQSTIKPEGNKDDESGSSMSILYILVGCAIVLIVLIIIVWLIVCLKNVYKSKTSTTTRSQTVVDEPITEGPLDPRYGRLDPNLNLSLRIANPSVPNLDQHMPPP